LINTLIIYICFVQALFCLLEGILGGVWHRDFQEDNYYLPLTYVNSVVGVLNYFSYFLLMNTLLPISLIVTLEIVKVCQTFFIVFDVLMYSQERDKTAKVSNMTLVEELGQVSYIFSDKTGTLTRNIMEFKFMQVGDELYGNKAELEPTMQGQIQRQVTHTDTHTGIELAFNSEDLTALLNGEENYDMNYSVKSSNKKCEMKIKSQRDLVIEFMKVLSLAHECVPETISTSSGETITFYQGPSPDEVTLVDFAKYQGFDFQQQADSYSLMEMNLACLSECPESRYQVYRRMEFNSDRKRMSVLLRDPKDGLIKMYTKGADSIIKSRLDPEQIDQTMMQTTDHFLTKASVKGLRTLLMAMKIFDKEEFEDFQRQVAQAEEDVLNRDKLLAQIFDKYERGLVLLGATAVEDRLQDRVPETIKDLQDASIKIWMLTGDKLETAENIGLSCKLIQNDMVVWKLSSPQEVREFCCTEKARQNDQLILNNQKRGILVEAQALTLILSNFEYRKFFLKIAKSCEGVICCRVSPSQKADVVRLIKSDDPEAITLAIGDGANDVSMILEAHIGVGLYGNEGMRAVQSGDFALAEFQYLWRLILVHGRLNYLRNAELVLYFFYKNLVFTMPQFYFGFLNGFSA